MLQATKYSVSVRDTINVSKTQQRFVLLIFFIAVSGHGYDPSNYTKLVYDC